MFTIRERTRRRCCRAGFLLLCIAPTLATIAAAVAWHTPALTRARISACEAQWSARLGLAVVMDRLAAPRPGVTVVEGMQLNDLETGVSWLACGWWKCPKPIADWRSRPANPSSKASRFSNFGACSTSGSYEPPRTGR